MSKTFRALMISGVLVFAPLAAQAKITATPSDPLNAATLQADQAAIDAALAAYNKNPSTQTQIDLLSAQLQFQVDQLALGVPGPVEGVGLPFVLMGLAAGGYALRRKSQGPVDSRDASTSA